MLLLSSTLNAQTAVSGGIYSNVTWTKANSPYLVTDTVVVFPGMTLTIEPGVSIEFSSPNSWIDVRGTLVANGSAADTIYFYAASSVSTIPTALIYIESNTKPQLSYCKFTNSTKAFIYQYYSFDYIFSISNCVFSNCSYNGAALAAFKPEVENCSFINNTVGLTNTDDEWGYARNCTFTGNSQGVNLLSSIWNCTFTNNTYSLGTVDDSIVGCTFNNNVYCVGYPDNFSYTPIVENNTFTNNHIALQISIYSSVIQNNTIYNNEIGLNISSDSTTAPYIINNKICDNGINAQLLSSGNFSLPNNCWCSNDSAAIRATIEDGYKNISYGIVNYMPFDTCNPIALTTIDTIYGSATYYTINQPYKFYVDSVQGITYVWTIDGDSIATGGSVIVNWGSSGVYMLTCTAYDSGSALSSYTLPIDAYSTPLAVVPGSSSIPFTVYPNPNNGRFNLTTTLTRANINIYNSLGTAIQTMLLTEQQTAINLTNVVSGIYYLVIESDKGNFSQKIIVED